MRHEQARGTLLDDLDAFLAEHRYCGEMEGGIDGEETVWLTCSCSARIARPILD